MKIKIPNDLITYRIRDPIFVPKLNTSRSFSILIVLISYIPYISIPVHYKWQISIHSHTLERHGTTAYQIPRRQKQRSRIHFVSWNGCQQRTVFSNNFYL